MLSLYKKIRLYALFAEPPHAPIQGVRIASGFFEKRGRTASERGHPVRQNWPHLSVRSTLTSTHASATGADHQIGAFQKTSSPAVPQKIDNIVPSSPSLAPKNALVDT